MPLVADTTDEAALRTARSDFDAVLGPPTALVNVAGLAHTGSIDQLDVGQWRRVVEVNLTGTFLATKVFSTGMRAAGFGRIVMTATMSAVLANAGQIVYGAAKGGC